MSKEFYCFLCRKEHASEHEHKVSAAHFPSLLANFASEKDLAERLAGKKKVHICCLWLKEGHQSHQRLEFRSSPANKAHALMRSERRQSAPASLPPQQIDEISEVKSPGTTFLTISSHPNFDSLAHLPQRNVKNESLREAQASMSSQRPTKVWNRRSLP